MNVTNNGQKDPTFSIGNNESTNNSRTKYNNRYTKGEAIVIALTVAIFVFAFLFRSWRIIREGFPGAFDGYYYLRHTKEAFYNGFFNPADYPRDPPGFTLILIFAERILGLPGEQIMWSIFLLPQIIASLQLFVFFIVARRLTRSRITGLLTMLFMSLIGLIVYRDHNVAPDDACLYLVAYVVFAIYRYFETKDWRFMFMALSITFVITMIHHLTTFVMVAIWHVLLLYELLYKYFVKKERKLKQVFLYLGILVAIDVFVVLFWVYVLKSFPINFIISGLESAFRGASVSSTLIMVFGTLVLLAVSFSFLIYNFTNKKINIGIIVTVIVGAVVVFVIAMFFSTASPDNTLVAALVMGSPAFVIPPIFVIGLVSMPRNELTRSRVLRGWVLSLLILTLGTAAVPIMSSFLPRVILYLLGMTSALAGLGIIKILSKINLKSVANTKKIRALALTGLIGWMALTTTFAYPAPENNFKMQEVFWEAEFAGVDFIIFSENLSHPTYIEGQDIMIDADWRLSAIVEGYGGMVSTFEQGNKSWITNFIYKNESQRPPFLKNTSPWDISTDVDYIFITRIYNDVGYHIGWPVYGGENDNWFRDFPDITSWLPLNPNLHRVYSNHLMYILLPFQTSS